MMLMMPMCGMLVSRVDPRALMSFGFTVTAVALYYMATHLTLGVDFRTVAMLRVYQTMGLAFIFIPTNVLSYVNIRRENNNQVSSMVNFVRNIGGSVGIALLSTFITRTTQVRQSYLSANMRDTNPKFQQMVNATSSALRNRGLNPGLALHQAYARVSFMMQQQAASLAYKDAVSVMAVLIALLIPLTFIMKRPPAHTAAPPAH